MLLYTPPDNESRSSLLPRDPVVNTFLSLSSQVKSLVFDQSGTYLAVGGSDIRVYICKQWSEVLNFGGESSTLLLLPPLKHPILNIFQRLSMLNSVLGRKTTNEFFFTSSHPFFKYLGHLFKFSSCYCLLLLHTREQSH